MSLTKEIIETETRELADGNHNILHLHQEGSFLRAYEWSAFLACRYLHEFKVNKRVFKGIEQPVVFIGFPETSIQKWMPEGAEQTALDKKHLSIRLPETLFGGDTKEFMEATYTEWKAAVPLSEPQAKDEKKANGKAESDFSRGNDSNVTLTSVMQRILAYPIESKSPLETMAFLADVKQKLSSLI